MFKELYKQITKTYEEKQHDEIYRNKSQKYNLLYEKLTHIKSLIDSYDEKNLK